MVFYLTSSLEKIVSPDNIYEYSLHSSIFLWLCCHKTFLISRNLTCDAAAINFYNGQLNEDTLLKHF